MDKKAARVLSDHYQASKKVLLDEYRSRYNYWMFQLAQGFNLLMHGLGSKRKALLDFRDKYLSQCNCLTVDGFGPNVSMKEILSTLTLNISNHRATFKNLSEHANFLCKCLASQSEGGEDPEIFMIIHNIDGPMLRSDSAQTALSILAECPYIHIIASVDHIHSPLLWDQRKWGRFNWAWQEIATFETYEGETEAIGSVSGKQSDSISLASLKSVMQGLTSNACGIFKILVRYQLEHEEESGSYLGMLFADCYTRCRNEFLVNSNLTFKMYLVEFTDHKLVKYRHGPEGGEYLYVPIDKHKLTLFLEGQGQSEY